MQISPAVYELAAMERAGKLQCLVTINLHDAPIRPGSNMRSVSTEAFTTTAARAAAGSTAWII